MASDKVMREFLQNQCEQAERRMRDLGIPQATFHLIQCPKDPDSMHLQFRNNGQLVGEIHIWSPGTTVTESRYEMLFMDICHGIYLAEMTGAHVYAVPESTTQDLGLGNMPYHQGMYN